jgi:hypothetical protein
MKTKKDPLEKTEIKEPLKDHEIHHNDFHIIIKKGELVSVPRLFLPNLVTEGVIKTIPKEG